MLRPRFDVCAWGRARQSGGLAVLMLVACAREPLPFVCPELEIGDLAVSEIRGGENVRGSAGQWIELKNTTGQAIDLRGLQVHAQRTDGGKRDRFIFRVEALDVEAEDYVVLGHHEPPDLPYFVDYSYYSDGFAEEDDAPTPDGPGDLPVPGIIEVVACGEVIDKVIYAALPEDGTWSFNGELDPDELGNDRRSSWCVDDADPGEETMITGLLGTPGEANRPCVDEPIE